MRNYYFASTYGSGSYNNSTYNGTASTSTGADGTSGATGVLANTGFDVIIAVTLACLIIFIALLVRFWRRKPGHNSVQPAEAAPKNSTAL